MKGRIAIVLAFVAAGLGGCDGAERRDAASVAEAIARFRAADLVGTPAAVDALAATACGSAASCATRQACLDAGQQLASALRLKADVERVLRDVERGAVARDAPEVTALAGRLDAADAGLKAGFAALPACDESVLGLRRRYRL